MLTLNHILSVAVVLAAVCFLSSEGQTGPCNGQFTGTWWQDPSTPCSKEYKVCRSFVWRSLICVLGHFNTTTGLCQRFNDGSGCNINDNDIYYPGNNVNGRKKREVSVSETSKTSELLHRSKRQQGTDCTGVPEFPCPAKVKQVIIYPDFDYIGCTDYYLCLEGVLEKRSCDSAQGYIFYNPRLMSCEEYPGLTNTCVWRDFGDYGPFDGTI